MGGDAVTRVRAGLVAFAAGDALGRPWAGRGPREISRKRLADAAGPTGPATAAVLAAARGEAPAGWGLAPGATVLPAALALGWREPDRDVRRAAALRLGFGAVLVANLGAWALEGRRIHHVASDHADRWYAPIRGIPGDDRGVLDGLLFLLHRWEEPADAMRNAVWLGGPDPGLLAGLIGALLATRNPDALRRVPWLARVVLPDGVALDAAAAALAPAPARAAGAEGRPRGPGEP